MEPLTIEEVRQFIAGHEWTFAKTMAKIPHEYVTKEAASDPELFERFELAIERGGYDEKFFRRSYRYLNVDGYKYWAMDIRDAGGRIINRAKLPEEAY